MKGRLGVGLILVSALLFAGMSVAPFVGGSGGRAATVAASFFVLSEITFWLGLMLAGRETWDAAKRRGWRHAPRELWRKLTTSDEAES